VDGRSPQFSGESPPARRLIGEGLDSRLDRWVAEARVDEAVRRRARERWLRHQAEEDASLAGVLADVAERGAPVTLHAQGGRRHRGEVRALGRDFVALRSATSDVVVALGAITSVRIEAGRGATLGDRSVATALRLSDVLAELAAERAAALLVTTGGDDAVAGVLQSVGRDVVVVRLAGDAAGTAYVPLGAIAEAVFER
jgi:hypothetical protein